MCSCDVGFVCHRCEGRDDPYRDDAAPELTAADFDALTREPPLFAPLMFGVRDE